MYVNEKFCCSSQFINTTIHLLGSFIFDTVLRVMLNPSVKSRKKKVTITLVILLFISLIVYFNKNSQPVHFVQGKIQGIFSAPKSSLYALGKNSQTPTETKKIQDLEKRLVDYDLLKQDNAALKSQFESSGETSTSLVAAKILGFKGDSKTPNELIINAGLSHNIKKGMTVIFQNYFIGKIDMVSKNYSVVITPYNQNLRVLAKFPETNANGIIIGQNDFLLLDGVVITDILKKDGIIVTKGEVGRDGIGIVPDVIIGRIHSISKNETAPFQSAQVIPGIDFSSLTNVFVVAQM